MFLTPDRIALRYREQQYTFQNVYDAALSTAKRLKTLQINNGDFVGVLLPNQPQTIFTLFALQLLGVRTVILNNRLTAEELVYQLRDSKATYLLSTRKWGTKNDVLKNTLRSVPIVFMEDVEDLEETNFVVAETFSLGEICTVMYTSGTTGNPKGVKQTYGNHWWSAVGSVLNLGLREEDCWLIAVPLFHISGYSILIRSIVYGMTIHLLESFHEDEVNEVIMEQGITVMSVVSTMLDRMLEHLQDRVYPPTFRCMLLGGGPAPKPLLSRCKEKQIPVFQTYGMTETASQVVTLAPEYSLSKLGSAGKALFPVQLQIVTEEGNVAKPNMAGEIVVRGPNVTPGYLHQPKETANSFQDGWFYTGDIGFLDEEGFLFVLDRRSDLIISGGENIYPAELESVLLSHPDVVEAGVIAKDDNVWGQVPVAFVVLKKGATIKREALQSFCQQHVAKYKIPKEIIVKETLPRNAANKLLRKELRRELQ